MLGWLFNTSKKTARQPPKPEPLSTQQQVSVGLQHHQTGRLLEAETAYRDVLAVDPENIDALHFLGVIAYQRGAHTQAEDLISRALLRNTSNAPAYNNLGNALEAQGKLDEAIVCYEQALGLQPDYVDALVNLGAALRAKGELEKAVAYYRKALSVAPDVPTVYSNLGNALAQQGKLEEGADCLRKAIALNPDYAEAHSNLGNVLRNQDRLDEAMDSLRTALALRPDFPEAYNHVANTLIGLGRPEEAEENYLRALKLRPDSAELKFGLSFVRLLLGDYESGLALYENRLEKDALSQTTYAALQARIAQLQGTPRWQGEDGAGRVLFIWTDQGLGDTLMMMRYFPLLKDRGFRRLIVHCEDALLRIIKAIPAVDEVIPRGEPTPIGRFDCQCPLTSLPLMFKTRVDAIPNRVPYLLVPEQLKRKWASRFVGVARPRVGLVWAGRKDYPKDALRSIRLEKFSSLFGIGGMSFVNLQKGEEARQMQETGLRLIDFMSECGDLMETAALMDQLDLVISVDTAVMHLAGALGKPVWLVNRFETEWRWMLEREDSPWYPTMRIFRQRRPGNWDEVMAQVASALRGKLESLREQ